jgi:adenine phosphoribosyltransferase
MISRMATDVIASPRDCVRSHIRTLLASPRSSRVLIDDLIDTGGTMMTARTLLECLGAVVIEGAAVLRLPELGGSITLKATGLARFTLADFAAT